MGLVTILLLIFGVLCLVVGAFRLINRMWVDGVIVVVIGLILLACGGFIRT